MIIIFKVKGLKCVKEGLMQFQRIWVMGGVSNRYQRHFIHFNWYQQNYLDFIVFSMRTLV
jgi:hypothetical protein